MKKLECRLPVLAALAVVTTAMVVGLMGAPAWAASATGCEGTAESFTNDGRSLDKVAGPGVGGTKDDPFDVDYDGTVTWNGTTGAAIRNGTWNFDTGLPIDLSGKFTNASGLSSSGGNEVVRDRIGFKITGLYRVSVKISGEGGTCSAAAWVRFPDSPLFTTLWFAGSLSTVAGLGLIAGAMIPRKVV